MITGNLIDDLNVAVDRATGRREIHAKVPKIPVIFSAEPELYDRLTKTTTEVGTSMAELCRTAVTSFLGGLEEESDLERDRR
jgi:hypothetical protein